MDYTKYLVEENDIDTLETIKIDLENDIEFLESRLREFESYLEEFNEKIEKLKKQKGDGE